VASAITPITFRLSPGQASDDPQGRILLAELPERYHNKNIFVAMDKAYEGDAIRNQIVSYGLIPVVPPKSNRNEPWEYDKEIYKRRNEVERYFRRLKGFRRVFTRYDKLDVMYSSFILFAMICETLRE
jgi:Transposase and inactivated derivatives